MSRSEDTILIVDDEESIRTILHEKLESQYSCRTAENGDDALAQMSKASASLVLCDVKMPGRDGIQVLGEIVKGWPDTAVVMVTASLIAPTSRAISTFKVSLTFRTIPPRNAFLKPEVAVTSTT